MRVGTASAATLAAMFVLAVAPASADGQAPAQCAPDTICLWTGTHFTGQKAEITDVNGQCRTASELGISQIASVVNNTQWKVPLLYSDTACTTATDPELVYTHGRSAPVVSPPARSVDVIPIPY